MIVFPIAVLTFLLKNRTKLVDRNLSSRYGTLYQGIKTENKSTAIYSFVFIMRRFFFVCVIVFFHERAFFKPMIFL